MTFLSQKKKKDTEEVRRKKIWRRVDPQIFKYNKKNANIQEKIVAMLGK